MQLIPFSHWALAWLCPSASPPIRPTGASSFTAHSSIRLYEPKLAEQNKKKTLDLNLGVLTPRGVGTKT